MSYRLVLHGGPLDGGGVHWDGEAHGWPPPDELELGKPPEREQPGDLRYCYVLHFVEPVPAALGQHPNILLTGHYHYQGEADDDSPGT